MSKVKATIQNVREEGVTLSSAPDNRAYDIKPALGSFIVIGVPLLNQFLESNDHGLEKWQVYLLMFVGAWLAALGKSLFVTPEG